MNSKLEILERFKSGTLVDHSPDISSYQEMKTNSMQNHAFRSMARTFEEMLMSRKPDNVVYALVEYVDKEGNIDFNKVNLHEQSGYRIVPKERHFDVSSNHNSLSDVLQEQSRKKTYHEGVTNHDISKLALVYHGCILMEINKDLYDYQEGIHKNTFQDIYKTNGPSGTTHRDYGMVYKSDPDLQTFDVYRSASAY